MNNSKLLKKDTLFAKALEVFKSMTGSWNAKTENFFTSSREQTESDLTVIVGIIDGSTCGSVHMDCDKDMVLSLASGILKNETGDELELLESSQLPELIQGSIEELGNRIAAGFVNSINSEHGTGLELTSPICVFGKGVELDYNFQTDSTIIESEFGELRISLCVGENTKPEDIC